MIGIMIRTLLAVALGVSAVLALLTLALFSDGSSSAAQDATSVQVRARLVGSGSIEFGLRASGEDLTPGARFFPAGDRATGWLVSSSLDLANGAEVQIIARRHQSRAVEFAVRTVAPRQVFLPRGRFFPANATVGRWLISTPVSIPAPDPPAEQEEQSSQSQPSEPDPEPETSTPDADDTDQSTESVERISGGPRDGLIVENGVLGDPDAPILITEYGDPF